MKLSQLDDETRLVVYLATVYSRDPKSDTLERLQAAVVRFKEKHEKEMLENLLNAVFGEDSQLMT